MYIGLIVGILLGVVGNIAQLGTMAAWGQVANVAITCSAVMAIFPKVAGLFASGFTALTDYSRKKLKKSKYGQNREFIIAVNDALGYGEAATLTTGLLVIPFAVLFAFILPGNVVIPLMVLPSLPYMVEVPVALSNGNILKSWIMACIVFCAKIMMASTGRPPSPRSPPTPGSTPPSPRWRAAPLIIGFIMSNCTAGLITMAFLTMNPIVIAAVVAVYVVLFVLFKKNKVRFQDYLGALRPWAPRPIPPPRPHKPHRTPRGIRSAAERPDGYPFQKPEWRGTNMKIVAIGGHRRPLRAPGGGRPRHRRGSGSTLSKPSSGPVRTARSSRKSP